MLKKRQTTRQRGDTIVEVMIVLAILGMAISISYATANRSLLNARQAQENSEATELVQSQIEALRILAPTGAAGNTDPTTNIFLPTSPYCIQNVRATPPIVPGSPSSACAFANIPYTILIYNNATCTTVSPTPPPCQGVSGTNTLVAQATWDDVQGQGTDSVTLVYRAYPTL